jgi:DNA-binding NarL/FixJ family response regulator
MAEAAGLHTLACGPGATEATFSLAAVSDLLGSVPRGVWEALPTPQRRALDVALLRDDPGERPVDQRAVAAGLRSVITALASERPVLLAIDDVHWLDPASATVLAFVLRRLGPERVGVLAARRLGDPARLDVARLVAPDALVRVAVPPLGLGALQRALDEALGVELPRSTLARVHATSRGNPLFALEIGRLLVDRKALTADEPLPVPDDVRELVRGRVAALPAATRDLLLAAALLARPELETLSRAFGGPLEAAVEPAERAAIAACDGPLLVFAHPLHAAAVITIATAAERQRMHRRVAEAVPDAEQRARHLGLAAEGPDAATAELLDEAAASAREQGAMHSAAELLETARRLTPPTRDDLARARGLRAAEFHLHGGDRERARGLFEELLGQPLAPSQRADALRLLAELRYVEDDLPESEHLLLEALAVADDPRRSVRVLLSLMHVTTTYRMDFARAAELGTRALASLRGSEDDPLRAEALAYAAMTDFLAGRGLDGTRIARALALEDRERIAPIGLPPAAVVGCLLLYVGRHAEARELLAGVHRRLLELGDERDLVHVLLWLSWLETRHGDFEAAGRLADEAIASASLAGNRSVRRWAIAQRAYVHAHRGEVAEARRRCAEADELNGRGLLQIGLWNTATLALLAMSAGEADAAWDACRPAVEAVEQFGIGEPVPLFFLPDALQALLALGELDRAEPLIEQLARRGRELDRAWATATAARCQAILLADRGDPAAALAAMDRALTEQQRLDMPFERARTLLAKGAIERRIRHRAAATQTLQEAADEFERLGAPPWAQRARDELGRLGGRRPAGSGELTPTEQRVVDLAIDGLSNKEIAARLLVSVHTVEVHLSRAYAKLGVRSRMQLARRVSAGRGSST